MLPSADRLLKKMLIYFSSRIWHLPTLPKAPKLVKWPWCWCAWLASKLTRPEPLRESMGYGQEENEKQKTKKCRWAECHCQRNLGFHTTSAVPQTDHLHATPNWGSNYSKRSPYQVLSTYTVNEHTFQKANNSLKKKVFLLVLWSILICWESELLGFCSMWAKTVTIKRTKDLNYYSLCIEFI